MSHNSDNKNDKKERLVNRFQNMFRSTANMPKKDVSKYQVAMKKDLVDSKKKEQILKDLDIFVLDNSLRETTVGAYVVILSKINGKFMNR